MDIEMVTYVKSNISTTIQETGVWEMYTTILNEVFSDCEYLEEELYVLENLILLLKGNAESLNDANSKLYGMLIDIHIFLLSLSPNVLLIELHILEESFQAILDHSIPIVCSCYLEHSEVDVSAELSCVQSLINHIKFETREIKIYYFPRTDDLGFLKFLSGYLEGLKKNKEISIKEEIDALHLEVHSLLSLAMVTNQELVKGSTWTDIINMAYQAEYIVDLYLVNRFGDINNKRSALFRRDKHLGQILFSSQIIEQFRNVRENDLCCKSLVAHDVAVTSEPKVLGTVMEVHENDGIVGLDEEIRVITEYLIEGENELDIISIVGIAGVGKTTLALSLYKSPSMANHFDSLAWCTVSQSYRCKDLLLAILDQVASFDKNKRSIVDDKKLADHLNAFDKNQRSEVDDQELAEHLWRSLKKRRYLIVLDDVWDTMLWNFLKRLLPDDREGSRILITTRNKDVADQIGSKVNELHGLSEEKSWELFQKKTHGKETLSDDLLDISKGIFKRCIGLPLSIVIIAGILSDRERTNTKWNQIANSVNSLILLDPKGNCKVILELSYNHLDLVSCIWDHFQRI